MNRLSGPVLVLALCLSGPASAQLVDGVAAVVGDEVVLLSEVNASSEPVLKNIERSGTQVTPEIERDIRGKALRALIDEKLLFEMAKRMQMGTTPDEIDHAVEALARQEGVSVDDIYRAADQQGYPREAYREQLGVQLTRMKVIDAAVRSRISVNEDEVLELFDKRYRQVTPGVRVRLRHILLPWGEGGDREMVRQQAILLREEAVSGASFATLARDYSAAPSAKEGGLTVFREGEVAPALAEAVFSLKPGEISEPIETEHGVNLIQILDRFDPGSVQLEDVRNEIEAEVMEKKTMGELDEWLSKLRKDAYVEILVPDLR